MRILYLSPVGVYPPVIGAHQRIYSMSSLVARAGHQVTVIALRNILPRSNLEPKMLRIAKNFTVIYSTFCSPIVLRELLQADLVQFEYPFLAPVMILLRLLGRSFVLDEHGVEVEFIRELKRIPISGTEGSMMNTPIGFLLRRIPGLTPIVLAAEKLATGISSVVFTCSEIDASQIHSLYKQPHDKLIVIPNCATRGYFEDVAPRNFGRPVVLFLGSFNHPPNVHAALLLVRNILPRVRREFGNVLLVLVGRNPPPWLVRQGNQDILVTGEVEDPRPLVAGADVLVAPVFFGSGTRQKLVDYMALGKPIVSTTKGAEGLQMQDGSHFLCRDTVESFSEAIIQLLNDKELAELLGRQARELARKTYSWDAQLNEILTAYARITGKVPGSPLRYQD